MKRNWLKIAVGLGELPESAEELYAFINFAEREHIMAQVAHRHMTETDGKLFELFQNAVIRADYDTRMLQFEANRIERALLGYEVCPILLKGGSYVVTEHRASDGRRVSDLDIMVVENKLELVEQALTLAGWQGDETTNNDYDQAYYREWMHELPPMRHQRRRTLIDVHHRLTPKTARVQIAHEKMIKAAVNIEGRNLCTFTPIDRFLHASYHVFYDGELDTPARSLIEIYYLFDALTRDEREQLSERAKTVGAQRALFVSLIMLERYFDHPDARIVIGQLQVSSDVKIPASVMILTKVMNARIDEGTFCRFAKLWLYLRGHWLRMPFFMLLKHLVTKAFRKPEKKLPKDFLDNNLFG
ncbi:nucleotidyltransferase family protein [Kordiimonas sp. SCSIO 12610]|uniref:nucleotidyltransferase family protein n=1 Tax=Kordiimonas sp. SCSIO 12610 TaxID=2829597 RepID=UPI00210CC339|nr:nucleotidyltransferase family protein [Kordiimonas sp. SCSIO 12610]UTW54140.1 nucleotidyltransferase family protein [Kordiimonas sp. SCSIO 12610]